MRNLTTAEIAAQQADSRQLCRISVGLSDSTTLELTAADIISVDGIAEALNGENFAPGSVCASSISVTINNIGHNFDGIEWVGAEFVPYIAVQPVDGSAVVWHQLPTYTAINPVEQNTELIQVTAYDGIYKLATTYDGGLTFPATCRQIVNYCAAACRITVSSATFANEGYTITELRDASGGELTYQQIMTWVMQITCNYAYMAPNGVLSFRWFGSIEDPDHTLGAGSVYSFSKSTNPVTITGSKVKAMGTLDDYGETYLVGSEGYVIELDENPLVLEGSAQTVAEFMAAGLNGKSFQPMSVSIRPDLAVELGDTFEVARVALSQTGDPYLGYITGLRWALNGLWRLECRAQDEIVQNLKTFSQNVSAAIRAAKYVDQKVSGYDQAVEYVNGLAANTLGFYTTTEEVAGGGVIQYWHDRPELGQSTYVYKLGADGFFVSHDGGATYTAGFDGDGNVVTNILAAIGIKAEWLDIDGVIARINADGTTSIDSARVTVDGTGLRSVISELSEGIESNTAMIQDANSITAQISSTVEGIEGRTSENENAIGTLQTWITADADGLSIAKSDSTLTSRFTNESLQFLDAGTVVAYVNNKQFFISIGEIIDRLTFRHGADGTASAYWMMNEAGHMVLKKGS